MQYVPKGRSSVIVGLGCTERLAADLYGRLMQGGSAFLVHRSRPSISPWGVTDNRAMRGMAGLVELTRCRYRPRGILLDESLV